MTVARLAIPLQYHSLRYHRNKIACLTLTATLTSVLILSACGGFSTGTDASSREPSPATAASSASPSLLNFTPPTTVDFGNQTVNTSASRVVTVTNRTKCVARLESISASRPDVFSITGSNVPTELGPLQRAQVTIVFTPVDATSYSGDLAIQAGFCNVPQRGRREYLPLVTSKVSISGKGIEKVSIPLTLSPSVATLGVGQTQKFSATVPDTKNGTVLWLVNGSQSGNITVGTISPTGLYTAPARLPANPSVVISAVSAEDPTIIGTAAVTVTSPRSPPPPPPPTLPPSPPPTNTLDYYVSPNGDDANDGSQLHPWLTISHADAALQLGPNGTTVHVAPGVYTGSISSPYGVTTVYTAHSGGPTQRITYLSDTRWGAKIDASGNYAGWEIGGSYVDVMGFEVYGDDATNAGIHSWGSFTRIIGNHVHNIGNSVTQGCVSLAAIDDANYGASNDDVVGNVVHDIGQYPNLNNCGFGAGIYHSVNGGTVQNNIVYHISAFGIVTWHAANAVQISNNTVWLAGKQDPLGMVGASILLGCGDSGCVSSNDNSSVFNNIILNGGIALRANGNLGPHNTFVNNLTFNNGMNYFCDPGTGCPTVTGTITSSPAMISFVTDPGLPFISSNSVIFPDADYQLTPESPGIAVGLDQGISLDVDGATRPANGGWNLGAYQTGAISSWPWAF